MTAPHIRHRWCEKHRHTKDCPYCERDEAEAEVCRLRAQVEELDQERADWQYEANRLRAALEKCGVHVTGCATGWDGECDCGLADALTPPARDADLRGDESNGPTA